MGAGHVHPSTAAANEALLTALPFGNREDFEEARRGLIGTLTPAIVESTEGRIVWDLEAYSFLDAECPPTANPSAWRQAQLNAIHGLFEVAEGIYQVRGLDLSNMTIVEGEQGVLVIDPLISAETAAAALALYRSHRGERPVTGLLYTHNHVDHFGGARGVVDEERVSSGEVPVLAPEHFLEHAISENVFAGTAMSRRAVYMYGALLEKGPAGQIGAGLGVTTSLGTVTLIPPTTDITHSGQEEVIDGIRMLFQITPGTEAPAEMNLYFPDHGALCIAENATHNLHNLLTLRGAPVRDPHAWSHYLSEAIELFGDRTDVMFAQHHWPRWGRERAIDMLAKQRDLYGYLHDQTLRLMNQGHTGTEIAEMLELPASLESEWHCRGYYGSVNHNVKAVYQRYMGWFDGNPAHLWQHPPIEAAKRYVEFMGGSAAVLEKARGALEAGDFRWVAEVVSHVVFAEPDNGEAKELEARALEQLGYGAESGPWRNFFLMGAKELREGVAGGGVATGSPDMIANLPAAQLFDALAVRIDGPRAAEHALTINWTFTDSGERFVLQLHNGVLTHLVGSAADDPDATVAVARAAINSALSGATTIPDLLEAGEFEISGEAGAIGILFSLVDEVDPSFPIVTP